MESDINIHHIYSETGLVRGIGLYTESEITFYGKEYIVNDESANFENDDSANSKDDDGVTLQDPITEPNPVTPEPDSSTDSLHLLTNQNVVNQETESMEAMESIDSVEEKEITSKSVIGKVPASKAPGSKKPKAPLNGLRGPMMKTMKTMKYHRRRLRDEHDLAGKPVVHSKGPADSVDIEVEEMNVIDDSANDKKEEKEEKPKPKEVVKLKWNEDKTKLIVADAEGPLEKQPDAKSVSNGGKWLI